MTVDNAKKQNILIIHNYYQIPGGEDTVVANEKKMLGDKVEPILTQEIVEIYKELSKDKKNGLEFSHGDFAPWNLKRNGDKYTLFDWEHCGYRMPGFDLMHYATIVQKVLNGKELSEAIGITMVVIAMYFGVFGKNM